MNTRQRVLAILNCENYDALPLVHFGFWRETLEAWVGQGHIPEVLWREWGDGSPADAAIAKKLGFDCNWMNCFCPVTALLPPFEEKVLEELPDGSRKELNRDGAVVLKNDGATGIPAEVDHLLKGRKEWEEQFLPRLQFSEDRFAARLLGINFPMSANKREVYPNVTIGERQVQWSEGGLDYLRRGEWENPYGLYCGSLYGIIRNWLGLVGLAYVQVDDPKLFDEMIQTVETSATRLRRRSLRALPPSTLPTSGRTSATAAGHWSTPGCFGRRSARTICGSRILSEVTGSRSCPWILTATLPIWYRSGSITV